MNKAFFDVVARTQTLTRPEWLNLRRTGIGGSDAAAVVSQNPYKGPFTVWAEKVMGSEDQADSEAMRQGRDLEDYVARRFCQETGLRVQREGAMLRSKLHPFMLADIDRRVIGCAAGLEIKTTRDTSMRRYKNGAYPIEYYLQCLHYLAVTNWDRWYLAVLVFGTDFLIFEINRAEVLDDLDALIKAEESFWKYHVQTGNPPPPDGLESTGMALRRVYPVDDGSAVEASEEDDDLMEALLALKKQRGALDDQIAEAENRIKARMGAAEALDGIRFRATWRTQTRRTLNEKLLRAKYPEVDVDSVKQESQSRILRVAGRAESWDV